MPSCRTKSVPYALWPTADRVAWEAAFAPGDVFDSGPASHLAPGSRVTIAHSYARWLGFLDRFMPVALLEAPADRITAERVDTYIRNHAPGCSHTTVWNDVKHVYDAARYMAPERDWTWLKRIKARLERRVVPRQTRIIDSGRLLDLGLRLMDDASGRLPSRQALLDYRDGLIVAFLVFRPLRRRSLALLTIGTHLQKVGDTWVLVFEPEDLKNRRAAEFTIPDRLVPYFARYLAEVRRRFYGADSHAGLWPSSKGVRMSGSALNDVVRSRTHAAFGVAISLHAFRHSDATTIAMHAPESIGIAGHLLTHADPRTSERYYNMARGLEAGRTHGRIVDEYRQRLSRRRGRKRRP